MPGLIVQAVQSILVMPDVYAADAKGDQQRFDRGLAKINFLTLAYSLMVSSAMLIGGEFMLGLVNESFKSGYSILKLRRYLWRNKCIRKLPKLESSM